MSHTFPSRGKRHYRYNTCTNATKRGRRACPTGSLPAVEIENAVVDQIRSTGSDPVLLAERRRKLTTARELRRQENLKLRQRRLPLDAGQNVSYSQPAKVSY